MTVQRKAPWSGRFDSAPDVRSLAFTSSIGFDVRFLYEDIRGSVAHVRMLGRQQIIDPAEAAEIERGLWLVWDEAEANTLTFSLEDEDVHSGVERRLRELIGPVQAKLHTGRSRNDQVNNDMRLWMKGQILRLAGLLVGLCNTLTDMASDHVETVMPGFTHTQRAQPVTLGHHLLAYVSMFERDLERFQQAYARMDRCSLGSAALAGTTYPVDRASVAEDLGFAGITRNSMDSVGDRDAMIDLLYCCALTGTHLSRMAEELVWWSSGEIRYITFGDAFSTGSSIMPQKKNPDVAELTRGKTGRLYGHLMAMLTVMKGLPLTHNTDMQEDKEGLFDAVDTLAAVLGILPPALLSVTWNTERLAEAAVADFSLATDAADVLAKNGVAFREAHEVIGKLVRRCSDEGRTFDQLSREEWAQVHPVFADEIPPLTAAESIALRDLPGGTAPRRVRTALAGTRDRLSDIAAWHHREQSRMSNVMRRDSTGPEDQT
ncbi:MAG TPA: argininosuccinate lyase [Thermomicrobiales bacterium]|nr:argininosuccinate lyase [Thermomicrobiales bacterium]